MPDRLRIFPKHNTPRRGQRLPLHEVFMVYMGGYAYPYSFTSFQQRQGGLLIDQLFRKEFLSQTVYDPGSFDVITYR